MVERFEHGTVSSIHATPSLGNGRPVRKVLFFGKNMSRSRCTGGLVDALERHGLEVRWLNMATLRRWLGKSRALRRAERVFESYRPDLVFIFCRDLPVTLVQEFRQRASVVLWVEEALDDLDSRLIESMRNADLVCVSNPSRRAVLHELGVPNIAFVMSGFSPAFHAPQLPRRPVRDVVFIGGPGREGQRARFLCEVSRHFPTDIYGAGLPWERWVRRYPHLRVHRPVSNTRFARLCASSRIVLGLKHVNAAAGPLYLSNRPFLTLACRGFHLTHYVPGLECVFGDGEHLAWYSDLDECLGKIGHFLSADEERERIARAGHELVVAKHQYFHRIGRILEILAASESESRPVVLRPVAASG